MNPGGDALYENSQSAKDLRGRGKILLVSCYELGQQPLSLAFLAAQLERAGFRPEMLDISVESLDETKVTAARLVAISVPMHTAMRLGMRVAERVRALNPACHITFFGLYAALNADYIRETVADSCLGGVLDNELVELAERLDTRSSSNALRAADSFAVPKRDGLPPLDRYAKLAWHGQNHKVGYVAATHGCKHSCRHCPIPPVYMSKFRALPREVVLSDIRQLVERGVGHITFADPDFLNGPVHAQRIAQAMHAEFPAVTFDYTAKIEHLLKHRDLVQELQDNGCVFVVSAVESLNDRTLAILDKGHSYNDVITAVRFFKDISLTLRPSFVPFNPWDSIGNYMDLLDMLEEEALIDQTEPVQLSIRLLIPPGSWLIDDEAIVPHLGTLDQAGFSHRWTHPDPRMDALQQTIGQLVERAAAEGEDPARTFFRIRHAAAAVGEGKRSMKMPDDAWITTHFPANRIRPPRLTEDWFC